MSNRPIVNEDWCQNQYSIWNLTDELACASRWNTALLKYGWAVFKNWSTQVTQNLSHALPMGRAFPQLTWDYLCRIILCNGLTSENEEWSNSSELSAVFQSSQGHGCWGLFHTDLRGQIILMSPILLKGYARGWVPDITSVVMKLEALGNSRKPNSVVHLGDNAAHRCILAKRTTEAPTPSDDMRTRGSDDLPFLKQQHCFWGMGR